MKKEKSSSRYNEAEAVSALAALAQPQRLRAFRALVVAGTEGLTPGILASKLEMASSALSFHLKTLLYAGLASSEPDPQDGRHLIYRANFSRMNTLMDYLTEHCCQGDACELAPASAGLASKSNRKVACC